MNAVATATWAMTVRDLKHWYRSKGQVFMAFLQPLMWMTLFGVAMSRFVEGMSPDVDYFSFLAAGMLVMTAMTAASTAGMSLVWDRRMGFLAKLKAAPVPKWTIPVAKILSTTIKTLFQCLIILAVAFAAGMQLAPGIGILGFLTAFAAVVCVSLAFSSLFVMMGLAIIDKDTLTAANNLLNMPVMFASGIMYPTGNFPEWLRAIGDVNPLTYAADVVRRSIISPDPALLSLPDLSLGAELGFCAAISVVMLVACVAVSVWAIDR